MPLEWTGCCYEVAHSVDKLLKARLQIERWRHKANYIHRRYIHNLP